VKEQLNLVNNVPKPLVKKWPGIKVRSSMKAKTAKVKGVPLLLGVKREAKPQDKVWLY
jgi:hypothetical protein